jgi:hypothetical protein
MANPLIDNQHLVPLVCKASIVFLPIKKGKETPALASQIHLNMILSLKGKGRSPRIDIKPVKLLI